MLNVQKHIDYWKTVSQEDWEVAITLQSADKNRHALFFAHLTLEKLLKALVCQETGDIPPRFHNLSRLSELASIDLSEQQREILAELNEFNLAGRYPEPGVPEPTGEQVADYIAKTGEIRECLLRQLPK